MKSEMSLILVVLVPLWIGGIALCQTNEAIKANSESYAKFTHLKEKYKFMPDIENLLLLNYEHLVTKTYETKVDTNGNMIKEETIENIGGSIDRINYDSA